MKAERWRQVDRIFQHALELPPEDRQACLDAECKLDPVLRQEVDSLLDAARSSEDFMESPDLALDADRALDALVDPWLGRRIGAYQIARLLGRGGMSSVYLADRVDREYRGQVAIKVMRPLSQDADFAQRFGRERQILATLDHPNIATLIDSGSASGRPYFLMEFVDGLQMDTYCDHHRLSIRQRLELFLKVCDAVSHAHQRLVVHRDLKPSNILVASGGVPKLLDFGISKLLDSSQQAAAPTLTVQRVLTPDFASPEQILGGAISTSTDVYSLGLLLFRLLAGSAPYRLVGAGAVEIERILSTDPLRQLSQNAAEVPEDVARARRLSSSQLVRRLSGDLDHIVERALRKDPQHRYPSVEQLALDVRRHLEGRPICAVRPSLIYRLKRYVQREKVSVALMTVLALLALSSSIFAWRISQHQEQIRAEQVRAAAVSSFVIDIFDQASPIKSRGDEVTARELLDNAYERFQDQLGSHPEVQVNLLEVLGDAYQQLGFNDRASEIFERCVATARAHFGSDHPRSLILARQLASVHQLRGDFPKAESLARLAVAGLEPLPGRRLELAHAEGRLASILGKTGRQDEAESLLRRAIKSQRQLLGPVHPDLAFSLHELGLLLFRKRMFPESESLSREALSMWQSTLGDSHPDVLSCMRQLAYVLLEVGKLEEAERLTLQVLSREEELYQGPHPSMGFTLSRLARIRLLQGRLAEAERLARQALELRVKLLGARHPAAGVSRYKLAEILFLESRPGEARELFEASYEILNDKMPQAVILAHPLLGLSRLNLGRDPVKAEKYARRALDIRRKAMPPEDLLLLETEVAYAECLIALAHEEAARELLESINRKLEGLPPSLHKVALEESLATLGV